LADFQESIGEFATRHATVVAASVDTLDDAKKTIERHGLTFPVAYGLDPGEFSAKTGAFFEEQRGIVHASGFVLRPDATIALAVYSTGAIGRLTAADCLGLIDFYSKQA